MEIIIDQGVFGLTDLMPKTSLRKKTLFQNHVMIFMIGCSHFGLDDYFEDAEDLVAHIKCIFRRDEILMNANADYQFIVKMIGRSEQIFYSQTV